MCRTIHKLAGIAAVLCVGCGMLDAATAEEFSWQVSGSFRDGDSSSFAQGNLSSLVATWYPTAVNDEAGPWELAPILNRSSHVSVDTSRMKLRNNLLSPSLASFGGTGYVTDYWTSYYHPLPLPGEFPARPLTGPLTAYLPNNATGSAFGAVALPGAYTTAPASVTNRAFLTPLPVAVPAETGSDSTHDTLSGRYVWPDAGWYLGARAQRTDTSMLPVFEDSRIATDRDSAGLFGGKYFARHTAVELGFESETMWLESRSRLLLPIGPFIRGPDGVPLPSLFEQVYFEFFDRTDVETEDTTLSIRHVGSVHDMTYSVSAGVRASRSTIRGLTTTRPETAIPGAVPIPPGPDTGTIPPGALAVIDSAGFSRYDEQRRYSLAGSLFPTRALGVRATISSEHRDRFGTSDTIGLSATWFLVRSAAMEVGLTRTDAESVYGFGTSGLDSFTVRLLGRF